MNWKECSELGQSGNQLFSKNNPIIRAIIEKKFVYKDSSEGQIIASVIKRPNISNFISISRGIRM